MDPRRPPRRRRPWARPLLAAAAGWLQAGAWAGEPEALGAGGCRCAAPPAEAFAGQGAVRAAAVWGGGGGQPHPCHAEVAPGLHVLYAYEDPGTVGFAVQFPAEGYCSAALTDLRHRGKMYYAAGWLATFDEEGLPDARHVRITGDSRYSVKDFDRARLEDGYGHGYGAQTDRFINATGVSFELLRGADGDTPVTTLYFSAPVIAGPFDGRLMPPAVVVGENYFSYAYSPGSGRLVYHLGWAGGFTVDLCSPAEAGFREGPGEDAGGEDETDIPDLDGAPPGGATSGDPAPAAEAEAESTEPAPAGGTAAGVEAEEEVEVEAVPAEVAVPAAEAEHEAAAVKEEAEPPPPDQYPHKHFAAAAAAAGVAAVAVAGAAGYVAKARCARKAYLQLELEELQGGAPARRQRSDM